MSTIVVYPGRFHPFHRGHFGVYQQLAQQFGADNVYVATSEKQAPVTSPFTFGDKQDMMIKLGVPGNRITKVKNPYQAVEVTKDYDPNKDRLIFALGAKDMERISFAPKKDGSPSYMQPMPDNPKQMQPFAQHAYVLVAPTVTFQVAGADANSATQIRERYIKGNDALRNQIIADLYGDVDPKLRAIFDERLDTVKEVTEFVYEQRHNPSAKGVRLLERILRLERSISESAAMPDFSKNFLLFVNNDPIAKFDTPEEAKIYGQKLHRQYPEYKISIGQEHCDYKMLQAISENLQAFLENSAPVLDQPNLDYVEEKWSQKYKRSINCNNPRGFSQRAHCAGRKKSK
mgnify:CR=1 FL=1